METGEYLLPDHFAWTSDTYDSKEYKLSHLLLGYYNEHGVRVSHLVSGFQRGTAAVLW